ncbi:MULTISPECIES: hypothetical protein [unclassified Burkholderia]|uniref:hypothetical protein n=1 Tax=unclassified Burkholderia TaxID=2613784 RepID=UPI000AEA57AF|nr:MULTISPECIES: hypothetical protein [unclassified Burkholderia]
MKRYVIHIDAGTLHATRTGMRVARGQRGRQIGAARGTKLHALFARVAWNGCRFGT